MPLEISIPFRLGDDGGIAVEENPDVQIRQRVDTLVATEPGERPMNPAYGVALSTLVFETDTEMVTNEIQELVRSAMARFEPGVLIIGVDSAHDSNGLSSVDVKYTRSDAGSTDASLARNVNTAQVLVGGQVIEVIRG